MLACTFVSVIGRLVMSSLRDWPAYTSLSMLVELIETLLGCKEVLIAL